MSEKDNKSVEKRKGNPNWVKGWKGGPGRPPEGIKINDILDTVRKVTGSDFESLLAVHLYDAKSKYDNGEDLRSYTSMLMSIMDRVTQSLPKQVNHDVSGKVEHISILQEQDKVITERLRQRAEAISFQEITSSFDTVNTVSAPLEAETVKKTANGKE